MNACCAFLLLEGDESGAAAEKDINNIIALLLLV